MWTLSQARDRLGDRIAEDSTIFWSSTERDNALNEAQRIVASATRGVPLTLTGSVSSATPYLTVSGKILGSYESAGSVSDGGSLRYAASMESADAIYPTWRQAVGSPRWVIPARSEGRVYIAPTPATAVAVTVRVAVIPADMTGDADYLFASATPMEPYQGVVLNLAAALLFLKERYEQDAERFWQLALREMQLVGGGATLPPMGEVNSG